MRSSWLTALTLIFCMALQQAYPLLALGCERPSLSLSSDDQFPSDSPNLLVRLEVSEVEWERLDRDGADFCLAGPPFQSSPVFAIVVLERNGSGFDSSRQLLEALHRLRI